MSTPQQHPSARSGNRETPIRRQYERLKAQHPDCILLFQLGDFYEAFEADARTVAQVCGVTLTSREFGKGDRVALAGVPVTRLEHYLARLIEAGLHVAIAEQVSPPGSGLVEREVTRVVTPGTLAEPGLLREKENCYLVAVLPGRNGYGLAHVDVSTGEFAVTQLDGEDAEERLRVELDRLGPAELLVPEGQGEGVPELGHRTNYAPERFAVPAAQERLCRHFNVVSLEPFGCADLPLATGAAGAIFSYIEERNRRLLSSLTAPRRYSTAGYLGLDNHTRRNLELLRSARTGRIEGSLLSVIDRTITPMGGRLLRRWLTRPLQDQAEIEHRQELVERLLNAGPNRSRIRQLLGRIGDLERRIGRICQGVATSRELHDLAESLRVAAQIATLASDLVGPDNSPAAPASNGAHPDPASSFEALDSCPEVVELIERALRDMSEGGGIRPGYHPELDVLVKEIERAQHWLAELEQAERERTGIRSLKIGYNSVFGYYLEVTRPNLSLVPDDYQRKQTLVAAERFTTPHLKEQEARIVHAEARREALEQQLFADLLREIAGYGDRLRRLAAALAELDVFAGLAELAEERGYCRPQLVDGSEMEIVEGRHPVVEVSLEPGAFIPNDCQLGGSTRQVMVLTGPNMAGKSTYLRQVALIVLMAQIGSFVPARSARIGLVDQIFTRIGAQDDIAGGASTFMVEMMEAATILRHATSRSLIVLDEIGRGTSTYDGLSIARAVVEEIHHRVGARALVATHFHELADAVAELPGVDIFSIGVIEEHGELVFLRRVVPGRAERSYGIQVARLAGLPEGVTQRALEILRGLERADHGAPPDATPPIASRPYQLALDGFGVPANGLEHAVDELLSLDLANLTPLEVVQRLWELQRRAGRAP